MNAALGRVFTIVEVVALPVAVPGVTVPAFAMLPALPGRGV
jgi:hypothetical protein